MGLFYKNRGTDSKVEQSASPGQGLRLDICINYLAGDNDTARKGYKRGATFVTKIILAERDAQIDAEQDDGPTGKIYKDTHSCT